MSYVMRRKADASESLEVNTMRCCVSLCVCVCVCVCLYALGMWSVTSKNVFSERKVTLFYRCFLFVCVLIPLNHLWGSPQSHGMTILLLEVIPASCVADIAIRTFKTSDTPLYPVLISMFPSNSALYHLHNWISLTPWCRVYRVSPGQGISCLYRTRYLPCSQKSL